MNEDLEECRRRLRSCCAGWVWVRASAQKPREREARTARASQLASINALTRWTWKHFSPKVWPRCGSGFPRRKNSSNAGDGPCRRPHDRLLHGRRKTRRDGLTLTTSHVFWPNEPRSATSLLPFSQPNPNFLKSNCNERAKGGRAGSGGRGHRKCRIDKLIRKIYSKWAPAPLYCSKKHSARTPGLSSIGHASMNSLPITDELSGLAPTAILIGEGQPADRIWTRCALNFESKVRPARPNCRCR